MTRQVPYLVPTICILYPNHILLGKKYEVVAKSQLKKMTKLWAQEVRKAAEKEKRDAEAAEATRKRAEEAKKIVITEDESLSPAVKIKINQGTEHREKRIKVRKRVLPKCLAPKSS